MTRCQDRSALEVNYTEPTLALSRRASNYLARTGQVMELLYHLATFDNSDLSSWMVNLESNKDRDSVEMQGRADRQTYEPKAFHASKGTRCSYTFDESQQLAVAGCIVDEIVGVSSKYLDLRDMENQKWPRESLLYKTLAWEDEASRSVSGHIHHLTKDEFSQIFRTTLVAEGRLRYGHILAFDALLPNLNTAIAVRKMMTKDPDTPLSDSPWTAEVIFAMTRDYHTEMQHACKNRRLCVTRGGRLGMVPDAASEGDEIQIVLGGALPFVTRKTINNARRLIGMAYVHGIMDGEALESDEWKVESIVLD